MALRSQVAAAIIVVGVIATSVFGVVANNAAIEYRSMHEELSERHSRAPIQLHAILRPDAHGNWYIQDDVDHAPFGIDTYIEQTGEGIRIFVCCGGYGAKAGTIQISSDDNFGTIVTGHAGLGVGGASVQVWAGGQKIDPATVWDHLPDKDGGNFWVNLTLMP